VQLLFRITILASNKKNGSVNNGRRAAQQQGKQAPVYRGTTSSSRSISSQPGPAKETRTITNTTTRINYYYLLTITTPMVGQTRLDRLEAREIEGIQKEYRSANISTTTKNKKEPSQSPKLTHRLIDITTTTSGSREQSAAAISKED
jgi:hypothetical protein